MTEFSEQLCGVCFFKYFFGVVFFLSVVSVFCRLAVSVCGQALRHNKGEISLCDNSVPAVVCTRCTVAMKFIAAFKQNAGLCLVGNLLAVSVVSEVMVLGYGHFFY